MTSWAITVRDALQHQGISSLVNAPLGARTTYRVGGAAALLVDVADATQLQVIADVADGHPIRVLGQGSNALVADAGFDGIAVILDPTSAEDSIAVESIGDGAIVVADAGVRLPVLARRSVAMNWCGLEWMVGVPGSVGGAVRMNAGGHGSDVRDSLLDADVLNLRNGHIARIAATDLGLRFRGSALGDHHIVVRARFTVSPPSRHESGTCSDELSAIVKWRRDNQPGGQNAGSVFVNPGTGQNSAGALIDSAGLLGFSIGSATVSRKHGNFIQSSSGGTSQDVIDVMCAVQEAVEKTHSIVMRSEIRLIGFDESIVQRFAVLDHYDVDADQVVAAEARLEALL